MGWYGKPSGLASIRLEGEALRLQNIARLESPDEVVDWIQAEAGGGSAVAAIDAPLVIRNATGIRLAERELNRDFRRFDAGCHAANLGRPFAQNVTAFSRRLEALGFRHGVSMEPRGEGRFQIEVHPHAATVSLFGLDRIVKYKRGTREERARGLRRLRSLALERLPAGDPALPLAASFGAEDRPAQARRRPDRRRPLRLHRRTLVVVGSRTQPVIRQRGRRLYRRACAYAFFPAASSSARFTAVRTS